MKKLYIAGHTGMVGSAILRKFTATGEYNIVYKDLNELDLRNQAEVNKFFETEKPDVVIVAAAKVGGILANNTYRAEFIYDNLMIEANLIHESHLNNVSKLLFLGSSCIYPKLAPQPLKEEYLLSGYLESTNEPYAIAKIAGIKMCENYYKQYGSNFYSLMPTNMYGPNDNYNLNTSHVLPALIRKTHEAKTNKAPTVEVWGTGTPLREFMYVEDLANAILFCIENINAPSIFDKNISHLNIGTGEGVSILEISQTIKKVVGYNGNIVFDSTKPDGTLKKCLDTTRINKLGWKAQTSLEMGILKTYDYFIKNIKV